MCPHSQAQEALAGVTSNKMGLGSLGPEGLPAPPASPVLPTALQEVGDSLAAISGL